MKLHLTVKSLTDPEVLDLIKKFDAVYNDHVAKTEFAGLNKRANALIASMTKCVMSDLFVAHGGKATLADLQEWFNEINRHMSNMFASMAAGLPEGNEIVRRNEEGESLTSEDIEELVRQTTTRVKEQEGSKH